MTKKMYGRISQKIDTSENWGKATGFIPNKGELFIVEDKGFPFRFGDGKTSAAELSKHSGFALEDGISKYSISAPTSFAGAKGYYYSHIELFADGLETQYLIFLTRTQPDTLPTWGNGGSNMPEADTSIDLPESLIGSKLCIKNHFTYFTDAVVSDVSSGVITVTSGLKFNGINELPEDHPQDRIDWSVIFLQNPDVGEIDFGGYATAFGADNRAIGYYSFSEGVANNSYGAYSHTEGAENEAHWCAHAEGRGNKALGECSHTEGYIVEALGDHSHAEGRYHKDPNTGEIVPVIAGGLVSHAEGYGNQTFGDRSHIEGSKNKNYSFAAHVEGADNTVLTTVGSGIHVEGSANATTANSAKNVTGLHIEGVYNNNTTAVDGSISHPDGIWGRAGHIEGFRNILQADDAHVEGSRNYVGGFAAHGEGRENIITTRSTWGHVEGFGNKVDGPAAHGEGYNTKSLNYATHTEGHSTLATGEEAHAEGWETEATGDKSHAEGRRTRAIGHAAHSEGNLTEASGSHTHSEGWGTAAIGQSSHVEGFGHMTDWYLGTINDMYATEDATYLNVTWDGDFEWTNRQGLTFELYGVVVPQSLLAIDRQNNSGYYIVEGLATAASPDEIPAEIRERGFNYAIGIKEPISADELIDIGDKIYSVETVRAIGAGAHAEGRGTWAIGNHSHTEGFVTTATGAQAHAEGNKTCASGDYSHAEGRDTHANEIASHAGGQKTYANHANSFVHGYNLHTGRANQTVLGINNAIDTNAVLVIADGSNIATFADRHIDLCPGTINGGSITLRTYNESDEGSPLVRVHTDGVNLEMSDDTNHRSVLNLTADTLDAFVSSSRTDTDFASTLHITESSIQLSTNTSDAATRVNIANGCVDIDGALEVSANITSNGKIVATQPYVADYVDSISDDGVYKTVNITFEQGAFTSSNPNTSSTSDLRSSYISADQDLICLFPQMENGEYEFAIARYKSNYAWDGYISGKISSGNANFYKDVELLLPKAKGKFYRFRIRKKPTATIVPDDFTNYSIYSYSQTLSNCLRSSGISVTSGNLIIRDIHNMPANSVVYFSNSLTANHCKNLPVYGVKGTAIFYSWKNDSRSNAVASGVIIYTTDTKVFIKHVTGANAFGTWIELAQAKETTDYEVYKIIHRFGVIGDSLSVGWINGVRRNESYSWPACIANDANATVELLGQGGYTTKRWLESYEPEYGAHLLEEDRYKCPVYIIALGYNDASTNENIHVELGSPDDHTSDTFYGAYNEIINRLEEAVPGCIVMCMTIPNPNTTDRSTYNTAIRTIVTNRNSSNVVLIEMENYNDEFVSTAVIGKQASEGHYTAAGYQAISKVVEKAISRTIEDNIDTFSNINTIDTINEQTIQVGNVRVTEAQLSKMLAFLETIEG